MYLLTFPQIRQTHDYDCGAAALEAVLLYYGIEIREDQLMQMTHTTPQQGTPIDEIVRIATEYGLTVNSQPMNITDIQKYLQKKIPVILVLQAWTEQAHVDWEQNWQDGHYVVAIGYNEDEKQIVFQDPSSFALTYLQYDELNKRWHDIDANQKKYIHHGIAIFGKTPTFRRDTLTHME